jgi:hypothetical protein
MFISFTRIAVVSCGLATIVACSSNDTSSAPEDLGSTSEALHVSTKCPPSVVEGASCPRENMTCLYGNSTICAPFPGPFATCERNAKGPLTWSRPFCTTR